MRIHRLLFLIIFSLVFSKSFSQGKLEYSGFFDSYYYKGIKNLNFTASGGVGIGLMDMAKISPAPGFGLGVNYKLWPRTMFGTEFHYLMFAGKDNQANRNLKFTSNNLEFIGYGRLYFVDDVIRVAADRGRKPRVLKAYIMLGVGYVKYNASTSYTAPYPTTDSSFIYNERGSGGTLVFPAALGFSWRFSNKVSLITEVGYRKTFSDYLDGISKRANAKNKDGYMLVDFKVQISPWMPSKKKAKSLPPPDKYEGPKGTETWKNRKKEEPAKKRNYYEEVPEETPTETTPGEETPTDEVPPEENPEETAPEPGN